MAEEEFNVSQELADANARLPAALPDREMPLDIQIRSIALTIAQRHCGDTTVKEGNLYQQLKMDNKLVGPLTVDHVLHCAIIFEMFLWGKWSAGIAGEAMTKTLDELDAAVRRDLKSEAPTRPHAGEMEPR
jgi:hypothetical protein